MAPPICPNCRSASDDLAAKYCEGCGSPMSADIRPPGAPMSVEGCPCCGRFPKRVDSEGFCHDCGKRAPAAQSGAPLSAPASATEGGQGWESDPKLAHFTHVGRRHHINQDAASAARSGARGSIVELSLLAVADGVSSSQHGEAASAAAVEAWMRAARASAEKGSPVEEAMRLGFFAAQAAAKSLPYDPSGDLDEPETTLVAAIVETSVLGERRACVGWVGDSRAYAIDSQGSSGRMLTRDDSWLAEAIGAGMDEDLANADPRAHAITQCLGTRDEDPKAHVETFLLGEGESLVLCSDGLWNYCPEAAHISPSLALNPGSALAAARDLCGRANLAGGRDNVTVAILLP